MKLGLQMNIPGLGFVEVLNQSAGPVGITCMNSKTPALGYSIEHYRPKVEDHGDGFSVRLLLWLLFKL